MDQQSFPIAGVGASAGGVEALEGFFRGLPSEVNFAIVIVTHLAAERESFLQEIIQRQTSLTVIGVQDDIDLEPNHVYVLTRAVIATVEKGRLILREMAQRERKPVDILFSSLAVDLGEKAAGVVLSGGDGDGALGIKAIKERGGLTFAQVADGYGPGQPDMPESAIATGFVDFAIPVEAMGEKLVQFARGNQLIESLVETAQDGDEDSAAREALPHIYAILRSQIGHDFSGYKVRTFARRVARRMQVSQLNTIDAYLELLRKDPHEVNALFRDLLINVTNFFRDADAFDHLAELVIPKLFEGRGAADTVRVWIPGCSTGEEMYSIAILLREYMEKLTAVPRVQIFATDIDERALSVARTARYPAALLDSVSEQRQRRFFVQDGGSFIVSRDVRDLCIFSPHSVIRDPPFSRIDLVSCRNLLIYFGPDMQSQVIPTFHYALRNDGYLFLGSAENVSQFQDLFAPVEKKHRLFRKRTDGNSSLRLPMMVTAVRAGHLADFVPRRPPMAGLLLRQMIDEHVLERFSPAHVVANRDGDVVYYSNKTGKYLEPPAGVPTRQLLTLARRDLRLDLRTAFREAVETGHSVSREGIAVEGEAGVQIINLQVEPLPIQGEEALYVVLFQDQGPLLSREEAFLRANSNDAGAAAQVERELRETRDRLQSMIEEYETALEELKSSNEELVSVNEEMQSNNEELEASKEELQSVNEELHTVNSELNGKVEALDRANSDLNNLFESTDVATIFLDRHLVIRSFTPAVARIFNILSSDRGRPITDLSSRLRFPGLADDIRNVMVGETLLEGRVSAEDEQTHYLVRLLPYRDGDRKNDGVVVAFVDISNMTRAERRQQVLIAELQHRTKNLLTVVQSIARRTIDKSATLDEFLQRLASLSRVQDFLTQDERSIIDLAELVRRELDALGALQPDRVQVSGLRAPIPFQLVQTLGLAVHELATNALKHGALKHPTGTLAISWNVHKEGEHSFLTFDWRESGVSIPQPPKKRGFGRELIERALSQMVDVTCEMKFEKDGLSCHIELPFDGKTSRDEEPA
ncbi:PAS domain-containing protein [Bradyrhizobium jicamae]|uniref:CheR family methyltransferase n=1 Tax=Bradyrhizobium jicamae TaxID=280332 RepID=UPI001BAA5788|nr:CheR family methyltransferase [Bradyrhizobium jicamae]MBR0753843.1 PAS domain-containing protein [Bradyrhizobium jicamae]